jgi:hypothetical protein
MQLVSMWHAKDEDEVTGINSEQTSEIQVMCLSMTEEEVSMHVKKIFVSVCWVLFL